MGKKSKKKEKDNKEEKNPKEGQQPVGDAKVAADGADEPTAIFKYDEYWLQRGKDAVENTIPGLQKRITGFLGYLNTLSGATLLGGVTLTTLTSTKDLWVFVLIFLAIGALQAAKYFVGIEKTKPSFDGVDLRSPIQINRAHNTFVTDLTNNMKQAKLGLLLATAIYLICVPWAIYRNNRIPEVETMNPEVAIYGDYVAVKGLLPKDTALKLRIIGIKKTPSATPVADSTAVTEGRKQDSLMASGAASVKAATKDLKDSVTKQLQVKKGEAFDYHFHTGDLEFTVQELQLLRDEKTVIKVSGTKDVKQ